MKTIYDTIPRGEENAVSMAELARRWETDERETRQLIYSARKDGELICSSVRGYFRPTSDAELLAWYRTAKSRSIGTLESLRTARRTLIEHGVNPDR